MEERKPEKENSVETAVADGCRSGLPLRLAAGRVGILCEGRWFDVCDVGDGKALI